jgi:transcriptional regulator with PAS, ATPase and Fis domain
MPDSLLESELFGHVKGSFTGAYRDKPGLMQLAHQGTVFLDEVGEMSLRMQALLLRFLETGEIQQVGASKLVAPVDVRVICATHRTLRSRIAEGLFREDLFYRLNVIQIHISPLRERKEDVRPLLTHFLTTFAKRDGVPIPTIEPETLARLVDYDWPGNVRELKNVVERFVVKSRDAIGFSDLPIELRLPTTRETASSPGGESEEGPRAVARRLLIRMLQNGETFWDVVYKPFTEHDLTREQLRLVVTYGLEQSQGRYTALTQLFNMNKSDYKRFLNVLRKHKCLVPYYSSRSTRPEDASQPQV